MKQKESDNYKTKHWLVGKLREWRKTKESQHFAYWISQKCEKQDDLTPQGAPCMKKSFHGEPEVRQCE